MKSQNEHGRQTVQPQRKPAQVVAINRHPARLNQAVNRARYSESLRSLARETKLPERVIWREVVERLDWSPKRAA